MHRRSEAVTTGVARALHRSLLKADGITDERWSGRSSPCSTPRNDIIPGHNNLDKIAEP